MAEDPEWGLSDAEALARLGRAGPNELPSSKPRSVFRIAFEVVREPMLLLLIACGCVYLWLGDEQEALVLLCFVFIVIGITFYQERKTERALEALRDLSSPRALVIRGGVRKRIPGREVVPGDLMVLSEGDRVAADGVLVECVHLATDESLLTGEAVAVRKSRGSRELAMGKPGGDDLPFVYSGTVVVGGSGIAQALATGKLTELGKIGKALLAVEPEQTLVQRDTRQMVRVLAMGGVGLCALLVLFYGATRGDWLQGFLAALALAMAILPEELPVILTVFLALGAWRLSRVQVLTRRMAAIEMLGATTALCVDKTGTLTLNQMTVVRLSAGRQTKDVSEKLDGAFAELTEYAVLACRPKPFDPMEIAIHKLQATPGDLQLVREYPLTRELLAVTQIWKGPGSLFAATKGAPEAIAELCGLNGEVAQDLKSRAAQMAGDSLRVLGVAKGRVIEANLPETQRGFQFTFLGLLALEDPLRPAVPQAIAECVTAGIRVILITGDYAATAASIGKQIGLDMDGGVVQGNEIEGMAKEALQKRVAESNVFARAVPEQKLSLVEALKANDEIVAMTGDGVNDAPALKAAHIGIAMGQRGTDVAREAADLVLLDDNFLSIVAAIRLGRRVYDNLQKAMGYTFAIHVPIAGLSLFAVMFRWPLILEPIHIAFLELIIDPACSIVFEAEPGEPDLMQRPPRPASAHLFDRGLVVRSLLQGFGVLVILLGVFALALWEGHGATDARALTFAALVMANLALIVTNRSWTKNTIEILRAPNRAMWWVVGSAIGMLVLVLYVPFLQALFRFSPLHGDDLALCAGAGVLSILWLEALKSLDRWRGQGRTKTLTEVRIES